MNFTGSDWRTRRNLLNHRLNDSLPNLNHYNIAEYCTEAKKSDLYMFQEDVLHNFHLIPDPLRKNLADTIITGEEKPSKIFEKPQNFEMAPSSTEKIRQDTYPSFSSIGNFISGVFSVISGAVFQKRAKTTSQYDDCLDPNNHITETVHTWLPSKIGDQNIIEQGNGQIPDNFKMDTDCKTAVSSCEDKLKELKELLARKKQNALKVEKEKSAEVFENGTEIPQSIDCVDEKFEDALSSPLSTTPSPEGTQNGPIKETMEIVKHIPNDYNKEINYKNTIDSNKQPHIESNNTQNLNGAITQIGEAKGSQIELKTDDKNEGVPIVTACEDKSTELSSIIQEKRKTNKDKSDEDIHPDISKNSKIEPKRTQKPIPIRPNDKRFKNPNRLVEKRKKGCLLKNINEDMKFANEIATEEVSSSLENSPRVATPEFSPKTDKAEYFDEVAGKFTTSSTPDSDDSFQIVFADSPCRTRKVSDCDSEDSFIIFEEEPPENCYTTTDVFGDNDIETSDAESEASDSGFATTLCHNLSRTVSDLTDDSLYADEVKCNGDEVDCAVGNVCEVISGDKLKGVKSKGLLLDEERKMMKKEQPPKKVTFSKDPPNVKVMRVWAFASKQARIGDWQRQILDRDRFKRRIADVEVAISWVLKPQHRSRVMFQRFMPWWNALRRKEIAEKKEQERLRKEAEEKQRIEDEKRRAEEERIRLEEEERKREEDARLIEQIKQTLLREERINKRRNTPKAKEKAAVRNALMRRSFKRLEKNLVKFSDAVESLDVATASNTNKIEPLMNGDNVKDSVVNDDVNKVDIEEITPT